MDDRRQGAQQLYASLLTLSVAFLYDRFHALDAGLLALYILSIIGQLYAPDADFLALLGGERLLCQGALAAVEDHGARIFLQAALIGDRELGRQKQSSSARAEARIYRRYNGSAEVRQEREQLTPWRKTVLAAWIRRPRRRSRTAAVIEKGCREKKAVACY